MQHELTVSVADLLGRPGRYRDISLSHPIVGVGGALARLHEGPVSMTLRAESVVEGVLVTGRLTAVTDLRCARCLEGFAREMSVEVCELFASPGADADEDAYRVRGTEIDLEPMAREALVLGLPLNPLCDESCAGICATCGADLRAGACACTDDDTDPRWAALSALRDRLED